MYLKKLKIGNVELENNLILAPMAGVTNQPFRMICKKFEPGMVCTEMASSRAIFHDDKKTNRLLNTEGEKRPISMQIFGSDEGTMAYAANYVSQMADIVDINMGCPAPKVVKNGDGSKLLLDLPQAEKIMKAVIQNSKVPVTLKYRKGWDKDNLVAIEIAKIAEKVGIAAITIHGRTRSEFYSGKADLEMIKQVKQAVSIPVIGNGDVIDEESALRMFEETGVDGIMIGRGSFGNPWIFKKIAYFLETGKKMPETSLEERLQIMKQHIDLAVKEKGEIAVKELRKHIAWYTKNLKNSSEFRNSMNQLETEAELINKIEEYFKTLSNKMIVD